MCPEGYDRLEAELEVPSSVSCQPKQAKFISVAGDFVELVSINPYLSQGEFIDLRRHLGIIHQEGNGLIYLLDESISRACLTLFATAEELKATNGLYFIKT